MQFLYIHIFKVLFGGIIMKKILAIILTVAMLLGVVVFNSSADTIQQDTALPSATLVTNEGSPLDLNGDVTQNGSKFIFTLRFDYFIPIRGIDVTIDAGEATITNVESFNLPTAVLGDTEFDENYVYKRDNHAIRFVDINITGKSRIVCSVDSPNATAIVKVEGKYADTGETLFKIQTKSQNYEMLEENKEINSTSDVLNQPNENEGYFIPYGAVYTGSGNNITFAEKSTNGSFADVNNYNYLKFKLPKEVKDMENNVINKLTPFGAAKQLDPKPVTDNPALTNSAGSWRFGSYSTYDDLTDTETETGVTNMHHGTMMFVGDWLSLKEYYIKQGNSVQQFVKAIYEEMTNLENNKQLDINEVDKFTTHHVSYRVPNRKYSEATKETEEQYVWIDVYKYPRKHYIWRDFEGKLEYAIRLHNMQPDRTYTAVAYCLKDGDEPKNAQISHNVKSIYVNSKFQLGVGTEN